MTSRPGWTRSGTRRPFRYLDSSGNRIKDPAVVERLDKLAIPPAWRDVWIAPGPKAKVQATGLDAAGRKQYIYHPDFRAQQEAAKFGKLIQFAEKLPDIRQAMGEHMMLEPLDPLRVCAIAVRLTNLAWFRVGSERYAKESRTYGVTTLFKSHVQVRGKRVSFKFRAKHKIQVRTALVDTELSDAIAALQQTPGTRLFRYEVDGRLCNLTDRRLNEYIKEYMGPDFSIKDFRTWAARCSPRSSSRSEARSREGRAEARGRGGDAPRRGAARQYACRHARVLRLPGGRRAVSRRENDRRFPAAPFADRHGQGYRPGSRGTGDAQPVAFAPNSQRARSRLNCAGISLRFPKSFLCLQGGTLGPEDDSRVRPMRQGSRRGKRRGHSPDLAGRTPRLQAGRPV